MHTPPLVRHLLALGCAGTINLHAEWGTLSEMHHYRECFGLGAAKPGFKVTMLSSTAPGNVFHPGESPQFTFQLENLGDQPLATTGRVEVIHYAQATFAGDQWYPDLVRLETHAPLRGSATVSSQTGFANGRTNWSSVLNREAAMDGACFLPYS